MRSHIFFVIVLFCILSPFFVFNTLFAGNIALENEEQVNIFNQGVSFYNANNYEAVVKAKSPRLFCSCSKAIKLKATRAIIIKPVASPSKPSVRFTALVEERKTRTEKGIKNNS